MERSMDSYGHFIFTCLTLFLPQGFSKSSSIKLEIFILYWRVKDKTSLFFLRVGFTHLENLSMPFSILSAGNITEILLRDTERSSFLSTIIWRINAVSMYFYCKDMCIPKQKLRQIYMVGANFKISTHATWSSAQSHCLITYPLPGVVFCSRLWTLHCCSYMQLHKSLLKN